MDLVRVLAELGFTVQSGKSSGHKVVKHPRIKGLYFNFDCGHGRDPQPKSVYVDSVRRVLGQFRDELSSLEVGTKDSPSGLLD